MPIEYYSPVSGGAVATVIMQQARELLARGHDVSVLTVLNDDPTYPIGQIVPIKAPNREELGRFQRIGCKIKRRLFAWDYPYYGYYQKSFMQALARLNPAPDAVVVHNDMISPVHIRRVLPDAQVMVYLHNEQHTASRTVQRTIQATDRFLCVSDYIRIWAEAQYRIPWEKLATVRNGVDLEVFHPAEDDSNSNLGMGVLFVGRINFDKGPDILADAVAGMRAGGSRIRLSVAGGVWWYDNDRHIADPYLVSLKIKMDAAGAIYLGHQPRSSIPALLREHDVVVVPSRWNDPCPLVPLEAMASGRALVTTRRGGIPEICGDAAVYFDPEQPATLAHALSNLEQNPARLQAAQKAARRHAEQLGWSVNVDHFLAVMGTAIEGEAQPTANRAIDTTVRPLA